MLTITHNQSMRLHKRCAACGKKMEKTQSEGIPYWTRKRACSPSCASLLRRGKPSWNVGLTAKTSRGVARAAKKRIGVKRTLEMRKRMSEGHARTMTYGPKNPHWKGNKAGYHAFHEWARSHFIKKGVCEICWQKRKTQWASKSKTSFARYRSGWRELCSPCHKHVDFGHVRRWKRMIVWVNRK